MATKRSMKLTVMSHADWTKHAQLAGSKRFRFHGAFDKKSDAVSKEQATPGAFIRTVQFPSGPRFAVLSAMATKKRERKKNGVFAWAFKKLTKRRKKSTARRTATAKAALPQVVQDVVSALRNQGYRVSDAKAMAVAGYERAQSNDFGKVFRASMQRANPKRRVLMSTKKRKAVRNPERQYLAKGKTYILDINRGLEIARGTSKDGYSDAEARKVFMEKKGYLRGWVMRDGDGRGENPRKRAANKTARRKNSTLALRALVHAGTALSAAGKSLSKTAGRSKSDQQLARKAKQALKRDASKVRRKVSALKRRVTRANPKRRTGAEAQGARKAYEMFNGRQPRKVKAVTVRKGTLPADRDYAKLGDLVKLITEKGEISFTERERPMLVTDSKARALYFVGGSQDLANVPAVKRVNPGRGMSDMGEVLQIEYLGRKKFDGFEPVVYFHRFGEDNGKRPRLMYDAQRKTMHLAGGDYKIKDVGIVN